MGGNPPPPPVSYILTARVSMSVVCPGIKIAFTSVAGAGNCFSCALVQLLSSPIQLILNSAFMATLLLDRLQILLWKVLGWFEYKFYFKHFQFAQKYEDSCLKKFAHYCITFATSY